LIAEARALWAELERETGATVLHPGSGVATAAPSGQGRLREIAAAMDRAGVPSEWLDPAAAEAGWPGMRSPGPVLHEPHPGRVEADAAVTALQEATDRSGWSGTIAGSPRSCPTGMASSCTRPPAPPLRMRGSYPCPN
jgi:sarcosine oxidase